MKKNTMAPRRAGKQRTISRDAAVQAARAIIDAEGLEALSVRRLAARLGVGTMTLYSYFDSKDDLLDQVALSVLGGIGEGAQAEGDWRLRLTRTMKQLHIVMREHPEVSALSLSRRGPIAALDPFRESVLAILRDAGFSARDSVHALTALVTYVTGYTIVELTRSEAQIGKERARLAALPKERFPHLSAASRHYAAQFSRQAFDSGLKSLIDGLAAGRD